MSNEKSFIDEIFDVIEDSFKLATKSTLFAKGIPASPLYAKHSFDDELKEHVLTIQSAGFKKDDVVIETNNEGIIIKGEIKDEKLKEKVLRNNFHYIYHEKDINVDSINASLNDGLLIIKFKTNIEKSSRKIEIK